MSDYHITRDYYSAIAATLLAGDIQARVVSNSATISIEVKLIDGGRVLWSNVPGYCWGYAIIPLNGQMRGDMTDNRWDLSVEDAARMIAMFEYGSPAEYPRDTPPQGWMPEQAKP